MHTPKQTQRSVQDYDAPKRSLLTVGEYSGLQQFEPSEIIVVANEEEFKFRADVNSGINRANEHADKLRLAHFPSLTVALQETHGVTADPFKGLQISSPGEVLLPLSFSRRHGESFQPARPLREWASWLVEHEDEKTVVTLGSSIRVVSMLSQSIELGIEVNVHQGDACEPASVMPIGTLRVGFPFCLPLWIAMQQNTWRCSVRLASEYHFSPLFSVSPDGSAGLESTFSGCIECRPRSGDTQSAWLAVTQQDEGGILTVSIDCSVSVRNLLPSSIDWEIADDSSIDGSIVDGSSLREKNSGNVQPLKSGEQAEILSNGWQTTKIRLRPAHHDCGWSPWTKFSLLRRRKTLSTQNSAKKDGNVEEHDDAITTVYVKDTFNISLPLGLRVIRKPSGIDVTVYAEIWCTNCTSLDVIFGSPKQQITEAQDECESEDMKSKELSVAEATLKEISSLFEGGEAGMQMENSSRNVVNDPVRLPGQVAPYITEECFEYLEVESSTVRRRWWASENPFSLRESITAIDQRREKKDWIDRSWVSN